MQSSSFLALFHCLNYLRFSSATEVRIPVCPLPSKIEQSCIKDSLPSSELSLQASDRNTFTTIGKISPGRSQPRKNRSIRGRTRLHAPIKEAACRHALSRALTRLTQSLPRVNLQARHVSLKSRSALDPRQQHVIATSTLDLLTVDFDQRVDRWLLTKSWLFNHWLLGWPLTFWQRVDFDRWLFGVDSWLWTLTSWLSWLFST